jgi:rhodanese-related sulfurtransferase
MNNKFLLIISFFFLTASLFSQEKDISPKYKKMVERIYSDFPTITCAEGEKLIGKENIYFLDTREFEEFNVSHISTAIHVGYDDLKWSEIEKIPKNAKIIVYCSVGARSQKLGEKLNKKGYKDISNLYGGLFLWANQERKMIDKNGNVTKKIHGYNANWSKWIEKGEVIY